MSRSYKELIQVPAADYLEPERFRTEWESMFPFENRHREQYKYGLKVGSEADVVFIGYSSIWSAKLKSGVHLQSFEGIGYHAFTADLLRGFLDSGVKIVIHRLISSPDGSNRMESFELRSLQPINPPES